jgi:hypothetical protein
LFSRIGRKGALTMKIVEAEKALKRGIGPGVRAEVVKGEVGAKVVEGQARITLSNRRYKVPYSIDNLLK